MKKLISLLVVLAMVLSFVPAMPMAFATGDGGSGAGAPQPAPEALPSLDIADATVDDGVTEYYYVYEVTDAGIYTLTGFTGCRVVVRVNETEVKNPGKGFTVAAGDKIYVDVVNATEGYGFDFHYMTAWGDLTGDGIADTDDALIAMLYDLDPDLVDEFDLKAADTNGDGYVDTDDAFEMMWKDLDEEFLFTVEIPVTGEAAKPAAFDFTTQQIETDFNGVYYTWKNETDAETLLVVDMTIADPYGFVLENENWAFSINGCQTHYSDGDVTMEVVKVAAGETVTLFFGTSTWEAATVMFNVYTCAGTVEDPIYAEFVWDYETMEAACVAQLPEGTYTFTGAVGSPYVLTVNGVETQPTASDDPWDLYFVPTFDVTISAQDAAEPCVMELGYPTGTPMNPTQLESGYYDADFTVSAIYQEAGYTYAYKNTTNEKCLLALTMYSDVWARYIYSDTYDSYYEYGGDGSWAPTMEVVEVAPGEEVYISLYPVAEMVSFNVQICAGTAEDPVLVNFAWNDAGTQATMNAVLPDGPYYYGQYRIVGMSLMVNEQMAWIQDNGMLYPNVFEIDGEYYGDGSGQYDLVLAPAMGTMMNPETLYVETGMFSGCAVLEANNFEGYYYAYTVPADAPVTMWVQWVYGENYELLTDVAADIVVAVIRDGVPTVYTLLEDGDEEEDELLLSFDVLEGDELVIQVLIDHEGTWETPAAEIYWGGFIELPEASVGSEENPIYLEELETEYFEVVVNEGTLYYYHIFYGYTLNIWGETDFSVIFNGDSYSPDSEGCVAITFPGRGSWVTPMFAIVGDGEFVIEVVVDEPVGPGEGGGTEPEGPLGSEGNPAELVLGENSIEFADGADPYYFKWIATGNGEFSFTMLTNTSWEYMVSTPNYEVRCWSDQEGSDFAPGQTIAVNEGDVIVIMVATYDHETWAVIAGTISFTTSFTPSEPIPSAE